MDHREIQRRINALPAQMNGKGLREPKAEFVLEANDKTTLRLVWRKGDSTRSYDNEYEWVRDNSNDPATLIDKAVAFVAALPTRDELRRQEFMRAVGKAIELGKEADVEAEFVNPLVVLMKTLSENAITHQREAAK